MNGAILLIPEKRDLEIQQVALAWEQAGGLVMHLGHFLEPPILNGKNIKVYGNHMFCLVLE